MALNESLILINIFLIAELHTLLQFTTFLGLLSEENLKIFAIVSTFSHVIACLENYFILRPKILSCAYFIIVPIVQGNMRS